MTKSQLITIIAQAFKSVSLEDGIGLWEAQGHDYYLSPYECQKLRERDIKNDWHQIPIINLYRCSSSISFFDAKGMRFHLPKLLLFDLDVFEQEEDILHQKGTVTSYLCPDILFSLCYDLESEYSIQRFSALNNAQIQCVIDFLNFKIHEHKTYTKRYGAKRIT